MKITRTAHATVLVQCGATTVLTDPWLTDKPGWRHSEPLAADADELARVSAVLSSHGHPDHFDLDVLRAFRGPDVPLLVRTGTGARARQAGFRNIVEMEHWETAEPVPGLRVTATPARHSAKENTYIIECSGCVAFFGGDTRLLPELREVARPHPAIDVALLPINGVRSFGIRTVMDPAEAVQACHMLSPRAVIPIHYGLDGGWKSGWMLRQPGTPEEFRLLMERSGLATQVVILEPGETFSVN